MFNQSPPRLGQDEPLVLVFPALSNYPQTVRLGLGCLAYKCRLHPAVPTVRTSAKSDQAGGREWHGRVAMVTEMLNKPLSGPSEAHRTKNDTFKQSYRPIVVAAQQSAADPHFIPQDRLPITQTESDLRTWNRNDIEGLDSYFLTSVN